MTTITSASVTLHAETFGDPSDTTILLIMGQMASMLWWPDALCERVAAGGRHVVRYDQRDTGLASSDPAGAPTYDSGDLADDAVEVLDGLGVGRAHLVGFSMGGMVAQLVALRHPGRFATLTAMSTTPLGGGELPPPAPRYMAHLASCGDVDFGDRDAAAEAIVAEMRVLAGSRHGFDEAAARAFVQRDLARTREPASLVNHTLLDDPGGDAARLALPVLALQGDDDPVFPVAHAEAFARIAPHARLEVIAGGGHELHPSDHEQITAALLAHTG